MDEKKKYTVSIFGEFIDKPTENEYFAHSMSSYSKSIAVVALFLV
ncbi:MAG: hypothetical protein ACRKFN_15905 [Desulfitobacterium sp.]